MESRLLTGNKMLFKKVNQLTSPTNMWPAREFFAAKTLEQKVRYHKYDSTSFDLEPNLKSSPGGLRDIQLLGWISLRTYYPNSLFQLHSAKCHYQKGILFINKVPVIFVAGSFRFTPCKRQARRSLAF